MTIQDLARKANVTTRTIRYYIEQGLLPPPDRGRSAGYGDEYVERLELVRALKRQYLPLEEIRKVMQELSPDEIKELINRYTPEESQREHLSSASDYIASVMQRSNTRHEPGITSPRNVPPASVPRQEAHQARGEEIWHRMRLTAGIELHFTEIPGSRNSEAAALIVEAARHILESIPEEEHD